MKNGEHLNVIYLCNRGEGIIRKGEFKTRWSPAGQEMDQGLLYPPAVSAAIRRQSRGTTGLLPPSPQQGCQKEVCQC